MTHGEAMKLARELIGHAVLYGNPKATKIDALCDHILSGDHKREIENAAFERAAQELDERKWMNGPEAAKIVRALIQPPAQPGDKP